MRRIAAGLCPPIQSGSGCCTGSGAIARPRPVKCAPSNVDALPAPEPRHDLERLVGALPALGGSRPVACQAGRPRSRRRTRAAAARPRGSRSSRTPSRARAGRGSATTTAFMPNLIALGRARERCHRRHRLELRRRAPTRRSVCQSESTPPASQLLGEREVVARAVEAEAGDADATADSRGSHDGAAYRARSLR